MVIMFPALIGYSYIRMRNPIAHYCASIVGARDDEGRIGAQIFKIQATLHGLHRDLI